MVRYIIYTEGSSEKANGDLRKGFSDLFRQKLPAKSHFVMGDGKNITIRKFLNHDKSSLYRDGKRILLIDSDCADAQKFDSLNFSTYPELKNLKTDIFFMVHETEAWFISQKDKIDIVFGKDAAKKLTGQKANEIPKPKAVLKNVVPEYHEVTHGSKLLCLLDIDKLKNDFKDVESLLELAKP
jgi:hypothetical protein